MALNVTSTVATVDAFVPIKSSWLNSNSNTTHHVVYDLISESDLLDAWDIEKEGFPAGEADPLEYFSIRLSQAPHLFLGAYLPRVSSTTSKLVGFICSTQVNTDSLTLSSMSKHDPTAQTVCIHSLCVSKSQRGKGLGMKLFGEYLVRLKEMGYERAVLITHEELIGFYEKAGFINHGKSHVVYGDREWFDMRLDLKPETLQARKPTSENKINNTVSLMERGSRL